MPEKRNITKEDIFLEARVRSEGVQIEIKKASPDWQPDMASLYENNVILDGCYIVIGVWNNPASHLKVILNFNFFLWFSKSFFFNFTSRIISFFYDIYSRWRIDTPNIMSFFNFYFMGCFKFTFGCTGI